MDIYCINKSQKRSFNIFILIIDNIINFNTLYEMKEKDKKKILKKIRRDESLEIQKQVDLREKIHINKKKYKRKNKHKDDGR